MRGNEKYVKIAVIAILLVIIGLLLVYPSYTSTNTTRPKPTETTSSTSTAPNTTSTTTGTATNNIGYNISLPFYVKILRDVKIGKIYYKGVPPFYSIVLHGNISGDKIEYLGLTYYYRILSLGEVSENPKITVGNLVFNYYEPEKSPRGCSSYGFKVSNSSGGYYGDIVVSYCSYLYTSSSQIYIAGNATSNGLAGVILFEWKKNKVFVLIGREPVKQPPVIGDWFLQATYRKEYSTKEPIAVKILLLNARPGKLVEAYYNKDNRLLGVSLSFTNGTRITGLTPGKIYIVRRLVYLDTIYDYTWYPTLAGVSTAYFPPGEYIMKLNYTVKVKENGGVEITTLSYRDKVKVVQEQANTNTIAGILAIEKYKIIMAWTRTGSKNTLNITVMGPSNGEASMKLQLILANGTTRTLEKQLAINKSEIVVLNGEVKSIEAQGVLPDNQVYKLTLPLKP